MYERLKETELFLMDMDGTVCLGDQPIEGAAEAVAFLKRLGKKVCFLTNNSSKSKLKYKEKLRRLGIEADLDEIFTSGNACTGFLQRDHHGRSVYLMGTDALRAEFLSAGITLAEENADLLVVGFDTELTYAKLLTAVRHIQSGKPYIATHDDLVCPDPAGDMPDVGSFIAMIEKTTGRVPDFITGKPYPIMGQAIVEKFGVPAAKTAMIGDRLYTDIQFGINNQFLSILVLSGETDEKMHAHWEHSADIVLPSLKEICPLFKN